jgi:hypothetical protein
MSGEEKVSNIFSLDAKRRQRNVQHASSGHLVIKRNSSDGLDETEQKEVSDLKQRQVNKYKLVNESQEKQVPQRTLFDMVSFSGAVDEAILKFSFTSLSPDLMAAILVEVASRVIEQSFPNMPEKEKKEKKERLRNYLSKKILQG